MKTVFIFLTFLFLPSCFLFKSTSSDKDVMYIADQNPIPCAPKMKEKQCWKTFGYKYEKGQLVKIEVKLSNFSSGGSSIEGQYVHVFMKELDRIKEEAPSHEQLCQFYEGQFLEGKCHFRRTPPFKYYCETARDSSLKTKLCSRYHIKDS